MIKKPYVHKLIVLGGYAAACTLLFVVVAWSLPYSFPFVLALLFAALFQRPTAFLVKKCRFSRSVAALAWTILIHAALALAVLLIGMRLGTEIYRFITWLTTLDYGGVAELIVGPVEEFISKFVTLDQEFIQQNTDNIINILKGGAQVVNYTLSTAMSLVSSVPQVMMGVVVLFFSTFYFTKDMPRLMAALERILSERTQAMARKTWSNSFIMLGRYIKAYLLINGIDIVYTFIVFFAMRLPYAAVLGLIAAILDLLPAIGLSVAYIAIAIWMLISGEMVSALILMVAWLIIYLVRQYLEPRLVSQSIQVYPLTMLAVFFIGLRSGSVMVLLYLLVLVMGYALLKQAGIFAELEPMAARWLERVHKKFAQKED